MLDLGGDLLEKTKLEPIATLRWPPVSNLEEHANRALLWFEESLLDDDPTSRLLFQFFGLEAILGDTDSGLKGANIAVRRAVLAHRAGGQPAHSPRSHPLFLFRLYEEVRSAAVHGSDYPLLSEAAVSRIGADILKAINEFVAFGHDHGFTARKHVRRALDDDPYRAELVQTLLEEDPKRWSDLMPRCSSK